jgi:hypothetical protein
MDARFVSVTGFVPRIFDNMNMLEDYAAAIRLLESRLFGSEAKIQTSVVR